MQYIALEDGNYGLLTDHVARAFTVLLVFLLVAVIAFEVVSHPPGVQYLASALGLVLGDGYRTLLLWLGYLYAIALVAGNLWGAGDSALQTGSESV